ncbi:MAG: DUF4832 domain-containing protein [Chitinophagaceae bacterium]|nr:DUF4832 domain-containing protein [Chitinophagaceae bacterium]
MKLLFHLLLLLTLYSLPGNSQPYHVVSVDNPVYTGDSAFIGFEDLHAPKFAALRTKYQLDTVFHGEQNELKRILLLRHWIRSHIPINDPGPHPGDGSAESIIDEGLKGNGFHCGHYMVVQNAIMNAYGYVTRCLGAGPGVQGGPDGHHGIDEIWLNSYHKWFLSDAKYDHHFEKNGIPLSALEIRDEYLKNKAADIVLVKGPSRTPLDYDEQYKKSRANFAATYTNIEWNKHSDLYTQWPKDGSYQLMYGDRYFSTHTWIWDGKPHWAYNTPHMQIVSDKSALEWTPNTIASTVVIEGSQATISLRSSTPNLKTYQLRRKKNGPWENTPAVTKLPLTKERNEFFFRTINLAGVTGPEHTVVIEQGATTLVHPVETDEVLMNPGMGFSTFQMFNGDNIPVFHDVLNEADLKDFGKTASDTNNDHPSTTIAYFRIQWNFIEPSPGKYRWDFIDGLLNIAHRKHQTVMLRISPYRSDPDEPAQDVPAWYRKMVGPNTKFATAKWLVDPEDPRYAKYFGGMIRALGGRYDGHPDLESIDVSILGSAGEGGGTELLTEQTMKNLIDPYVESFKKTPLIALLHGQKQMEYLKSAAANFPGWRQDCLGDLGFWAAEQHGWTHMYDYYPQTIIQYNMQDAWKKAPVSFEICGFFDTWNTGKDFMDHGYSDQQVKYIIDQSLKWHMSSFNGKSSPIPAKWDPLIGDWLKKMGYRFVLRRFSYPTVIENNGKLSFESWWENKGVAPCYKPYRLAIRLKNDQHTCTFTTHANIREWLPGDNTYNDAVFVDQAPNGAYDLQLAIVDEQTLEPRIQLAIQGRQSDGWYSLGSIRIEK